MHYGSIFDYVGKSERLAEVNKELEGPKVWLDAKRAQALGQERAQLEGIVYPLEKLKKQLYELDDLSVLAQSEQDTGLQRVLSDEIKSVEAAIVGFEFRHMFSEPKDPNNAYLDVQSGSGGTEAQDWAQMLLRMYTRWAEQHGFHVEATDYTVGEVAGIKGATLHIQGAYAYGWLRTETGVHRLVRKSPFDSGNRRHTSFASIFVYPEVEDNIEIKINPAELRIDTFRASGAGGQHVNRTDSAIRITHLPTGIVVQCQNDRSQHKNKSQAMKQLHAKLYDFEMQKKRSEMQVLEESKADIGWGSQIRSYVLDDSRVKDLRTGVESARPLVVLDGDLDMFLEASLKRGSCP